ncbi:hypothetical protein evm_007633 [Chilo suppressalis]|nr:hypothetical protein evm_007633 [Chilo suppressalis]
MKLNRQGSIKVALACIICNLIIDINCKKHSNNIALSSFPPKKLNTLNKITDLLHKIHHKQVTKKTKRNAYERSWSSHINNYGMNIMPPYLVYNRKTGSYYPYYTQQKENNSIRRNMMRKYSNRRKYTGV